MLMQTRLDMFPFPSNGKANPKNSITHIVVTCPKEFQFPSNGKEYQKEGDLLEADGRFLFQFPSNGKEYQKRHGFDPNALTSEFQFPSNGKADQKLVRLLSG